MIVNTILFCGITRTDESRSLISIISNVTLTNNKNGFKKFHLESEE